MVRRTKSWTVLILEPVHTVSHALFIHFARQTWSKVDFPETQPGPDHVPNKERHTLPSYRHLPTLMDHIIQQVALQHIDSD